MSFMTRQQIEGEYREVIELWNDKIEIAFGYHFKQQHIAVVGRNEMDGMIWNWRREQVRYLAKDYNNKEKKTDDGKTWYLMVVQVFNELGEMIEGDGYNMFDPMSLMLFGIGVSGMTYAFKKKEVRDYYFNILNADLTQEEIEASKKPKTNILRCCICRNICENEFGNNPIPVMERGRCCDVCNTKYVIPSRVMDKCGIPKLKVAKDITPEKLKNSIKVRLGDCPDKVQEAFIKFQQDLKKPIKTHYVEYRSEKGKEIKMKISEEARQKLEDELLRDFIQDKKDKTKTKTKTKKELQAEETKRANKEKAKAKKEREDFYKKAGMLMR